MRYKQGAGQARYRGIYLILLLFLLTALASCRVSYVVSSSYYQAELLLQRKKNKKVIKKHLLPKEKEEKLLLIPEIKAFGKKLGLSSTDNYETISLNWDRTIWNVSACAPLKFEPVTWWFPVVGRVPYLGFFTDRAAKRWKKRLAKEERDVHQRVAGAYSTLGWFRDPVLPGMLLWDEDDLAEVVLHELAHATLWVKGSVSFNESFANYVGREAMFLYLADKYGKDSQEVENAKRAYRDSRRFEALLHALYQDLDAVYKDASLTDDEKRKKKEELYGSMVERVEASDIEQKERYSKSIKKNPWNNARLMQFKTYNTKEEDFAAILEKNEGDLLQFIEEIRKITKKQKKPFDALSKEAKKYRESKPTPTTEPTTTSNPTGITETLGK